MNSIRLPSGKLKSLGAQTLGLIFANSTPSNESGAPKSILKHNLSSVVTENAAGFAQECCERFGPVMVSRQAQQEAAGIEGRELSSSPPGRRSACRMFHRLDKAEYSKDLSGGACPEEHWIHRVAITVPIFVRIAPHDGAQLPLCGEQLVILVRS
jgi:hypothetical protein